MWYKLRLTSLTLLSALVMITVTTTPHADPSPVPTFEARYELKRNGIKLGVSKRALKTGQDGQYIYESITYPTGFLSWFVKDRVEERSRWLYTQQLLRPIEYSYERLGGRKERRVKLRFDWEQHTVVNNIDGDPWRMDIPPDAQDKLLYQLTIMRDLQAGREELLYHIADGGKLKNYRFEITGKERIKTEVGSFDTVKLERSDDKRDGAVWCARELNYLPVLVEQTEKDGSVITMHLTSVQGLPRR